MCFEILGFDVILDSHLRPWLLEINHTPSFTTDTPLDSLIKKNCIRDALVLMNLNNKSRNEIMSLRKEQLQKRVLTGKKQKLTPEEKLLEIKKGQQRRDEFEAKNLGNYEKVYPLDVSYCFCLAIREDYFSKNGGEGVTLPFAFFSLT